MPFSKEYVKLQGQLHQVKMMLRYESSCRTECKYESHLINDGAKFMTKTPITCTDFVTVRKKLHICKICTRLNKFISDVRSLVSKNFEIKFCINPLI